MPVADGDLIELRRITALGVCGALPEEQERPQPLEVDLDIRADLATAGASDDLDDTVDYGAVCELVERVITTERFRLLERLAGRIAELVLSDDRVRGVSVTVRKLRPPVAQMVDSTGVRITRARG